jgi:hypothetical protein
MSVAISSKLRRSSFMAATLLLFTVASRAGDLSLRVFSYEQSQAPLGLPGVSVTITGNTRKEQATDINGVAVFRGLPSGIYRVKASLAGLGDDSADVCIGNDTRQLDMVLRWPPHYSGVFVDAPASTSGELRGTIVGSAGAGIRRARIEVSAPPGKPRFATRSDRLGRFALRDLPYDRYVLRVSHGGYLVRTVVVVHGYRRSDIGTVQLQASCSARAARVTPPPPP